MWSSGAFGDENIVPRQSFRDGPNSFSWRARAGSSSAPSSCPPSLPAAAMYQYIDLTCLLARLSLARLWIRTSSHHDGRVVCVCVCGF